MRPHPMHGPNRFKLGVFSANADGGLTLTRMAETGFAGTTVSFVNFKDELPYFIATVLPLLREAGLRVT
jgi:hypothetical protein